jgi:hypothetical protein
VRFTVALLVLVALLGPPAAHAATAGLEADGTLRITAAPGEANSLTVTETATGVVVTDGGAPLVYGPGCSSLGCLGGVRIEADLGDGDDALAVSGALPVWADGGEGDDVLVGGAGDDRLDAGTGADSAIGGDGDDSIVLRDALTDSATCGSGADVVRAEILDQLDFACERVDYGPPGRAGRLRSLTRGGRFVPIPGQTWAKVDRRILPDVLYLVRRYHVRVGDGYAFEGHERYGEHPLGLAVDLYPGPGGSWRDVTRLARWAEPRQNHTRPPFRWVGWNGDENHGDPRHCRISRGCPPHLHLSWDHTPGRPGRPVKTVLVFAVNAPPPL